MRVLGLDNDTLSSGLIYEWCPPDFANGPYKKILQIFTLNYLNSNDDHEHLLVVK